MPRTARIAADRIRSARHDYGYIKNVKGKSVMCYKRMTKLLEKTYPPKNIEKAVAKLDVWIDRIESGLIMPKKKSVEVQEPRKVLVVGGIATEIPVMDSLKSQYDLFITFKQQGKNDQTIRNYQWAYTLFFPNDLPLDTVLIEYALLQSYQHALCKVRDGMMMKSSLAKYLISINTFLEWLRKRRKIEFNPADSLARIKPPAPKRLTYTKYEVELILAWFKADKLDWLREQFRQISEVPNPETPWWDAGKLDEILLAINYREQCFLLPYRAAIYEKCYLFFQLLWRTAMRSFEAHSLTIHSIKDDVIHIAGKGGRARTFPLYDADGQPLIPGVPEIITTLIDRAHKKGSEGLFCGKGESLGQFSHHWAQIKKWIGIHDRTMHNLRHSAREWWEQELGLDSIVGCDLSGHCPSKRESPNRKQGNVRCGDSPYTGSVM
ncbi:MAG: hypothetical protein DYG96_09465 [Chlorobi bacterium CHB2]|nr:hypothetical protein [Chlorobi bacterium CHB2]